MKKIILVFICLCLSNVVFADQTIKITNNSSDYHMLVHYKICAIPLTNHLDCLGNTQEIVVNNIHSPQNYAYISDIPRGYFIKVTKAIEKDIDGETMAEQTYKETDACEAYGDDELTVADTFGKAPIRCEHIRIDHAPSA